VPSEPEVRIGSVSILTAERTAEGDRALERKPVERVERVDRGA